MTLIRFGLVAASLNLLAVAFWLGPAEAAESEGLAARVDERIQKKADGVEPAALVDDAGFARRVYLDFVGVIPSAAEVQAFINDESPHKRAALIDQLLADPRHARHMRNRFHSLLMERRGDDEQWLTWLETSFQQNKPWDQMVREILHADPEDEQNRAAAFFLAKRLESYGQNPTDFAGLTRDVARLFLGQDLQCAQCHDHLFIDDYKQLDFQGLHIVFSKLAIRKGVEFPAVTEKPLEEKLEFVSVFDPTQRQTGPRLPGRMELALPEVDSSEEAKDGKDKKDKKADPPRPAALALFANELPRSDYDLFSKNIANRMWFLMMGRGLVSPLDLHHSGNPPSHPELLELLAREMAEHQFDLKWAFRELALSQTYQRASRMSDGQPLPAPESFLVFNEKRLSPEQLLWSVLEATGERIRYESMAEDKAPAEGLVPLKELREQFIAAFANPPQEPEDEINATIEGALFLSNNERVLQLLVPRPDNLLDRLLKMDSDEAAIEHLFLSVVSRPPLPEETRELVDLLGEKRLSREEVFRQSAWALLASVEFFVNH